MQIQFASEILYLWSSSLIKISILLFFLRFAVTPNTKTFKYIILFSMAFVSAYAVTFTIVMLNTCTPYVVHVPMEAADRITNLR